MEQFLTPLACAISCVVRIKLTLFIQSLNKCDFHVDLIALSGFNVIFLLFTPMWHYL